MLVVVCLERITWMRQQVQESFNILVFIFFKENFFIVINLISKIDQSFFMNSKCSFFLFYWVLYVEETIKLCSSTLIIQWHEVQKPPFATDMSKTFGHFRRLTGKSSWNCNFSIYRSPSNNWFFWTLLLF